MPVVALYQPLIPQNVGNISRTCVGFAAPLHIVGPTLVDLSDRRVRRAGLDHWDDLDLTLHDTPDAFETWLIDSGRRVWLVTKFGNVRFDQADYRDDDVLLFGAEKAGLPERLHQRYPDRRLTIPMPGKVRSFNLANTVAIVLATAHVNCGCD